MKLPFEPYFLPLPANRRNRLEEIATEIEKLFPEAVRSLKYRMPTFETPAGFVCIGNQKNHISVYTCSNEKICPYLEAHPSTSHGKGCLRLDSVVTRCSTNHFGFLKDRHVRITPPPRHFRSHMVIA